jgi:hypothetical protein
MKVVYIAGPYRSKWGLPGRVINIIRARRWAKLYWRCGYAAVCPHSNSALMDGVVPDILFLNGGLEILKKCDMVVMIPGWEKSEGAIKEREFALKVGVPVTYGDDYPKKSEVLFPANKVNLYSTNEVEANPIIDGQISIDEYMRIKENGKMATKTDAATSTKRKAGKNKAKS